MGVEGGEGVKGGGAHCHMHLRGLANRLLGTCVSYEFLGWRESRVGVEGGSGWSEGRE